MSVSPALSEDQFLCSICLDVFTDPVTTPCGHNYCGKCISKQWEVTEPCRCPYCKKSFCTPPELQVNTFVSEMVSYFRAVQRRQLMDSEAQLKIEPEEKLEEQTPDVSPEEKCDGQTSEEDEVQRMIQERREKVEEFKRLVKLSRENANREKAESLRGFRKLKEAVERKQADVLRIIEAKHRATERRAAGLLGELEEEISELERRSGGRIRSVRDWSEVRVRAPPHGRDLRAQVAQLAATLNGEVKKLLAKAELKMLQQFAADVTLDPETANPCLVLSADGKRAHHADGRKDVPENPRRFSAGLHVSGKQSVSSGRFYFEVKVKGKTDWILGVSEETVVRKGPVVVSPENGLWTLRLRNEREYCVPAAPPVRLSVTSGPDRVGVFVDYEEGLVSFYDVDSAALMYSFTGCSFAGKLLPFFSPGFNQGGKNSAPLDLSQH